MVFSKPKTPVTFPKTQKWNSAGGSSAYFDSFLLADLFCVCQAKIFFPVSEADFFSRWIFRRATLDQRPTYRRQFMMSVAGRSTFIHLEFPWMSTDRHRLKIENRPRSTGLSGELDKSTDGQPTINGLGKTTIVYRSINGGQSDDVMLQTVSSIN